MERAAVLIGVKKAQSLPELEAAWDGVHHMEGWARSQGIPDDRVVVITDETEPVDIGRIKKAIKKLVALSVVEQIVVYFSGHGINNARDEYWLLSDAIMDPDEAVNLSGSEEIARYGNIPHVVFISDACRTAAAGIAAQRVTGGVIFPNLSAAGTEQDVDLFFATSLGHPALEIPDVATSSSGYQAIFTETLLEALHGQAPEVVEDDLVHVRPLKKFLKREVPIRVYKAVKRKQQPDARVTSDERWLSRVPVAANGGGGGPGGPPEPVGSAPPDLVPAPDPIEEELEDSPLENLTSKAIHNATEDTPEALDLVLGSTAGLSDDESAAFEKMSHEASRSFGPIHFETGCGFKLSGERVQDVVMKHGKGELLDQGEFVRIFLPQGTENALLVLSSGRGVVLPAIQEFLTTLTFVDGDLVSVDYEPSEYSGRYPAFSDKREHLKQLRAVIAASSAMGSFRLEGDEEAERLARRMQIEKGFDPALSVYAAYAYRQQNQRRRIERMMDYQRADLGFVLFDLPLLSRSIRGATLGKVPDVLPFAPLLSQGWALLSANEIETPPSLTEVRQQLVPSSLWTLYEPEGVDMVAKAMQSGEV